MISNENPSSKPVPPVVVLGMHKSGTTLIADMLHHSGITMIEDSSAGGYDNGNKMERDSYRLLNIDLLGCENRFSVHIVNDLDLESVSAEHWQEGRDLVDAMQSTGSGWGFKDPRTLLTFSFWTALLPHCKYIGVFRDPVEVFQHYARRPGRRWILSDPLYLLHALKAWCIYNSHLLEIMRSGEDVLLIEYADVMNGDAALNQMAQYIGVPIEDRRNEKMRRSLPFETKGFLTAQALVSKLYGLNTQAILKDLRALKVNG